MNQTLMNQVLGKYAIAAIREAIERCANSKEISVETARLAAFYGVRKQRIYELTKDIRDEKFPRKTRSDKGKRAADLRRHEGLKYAAALVLKYDLLPEDALETARLRGYEVPVKLSTFQSYLRRHGLSQKARRANTRTHRRFEAKAPGDLFQFDISGTKQRWFDLKTRKILTLSELEVSKNHPNDNPRRVKIWRFNLLDDHSRYAFTRFFAVDKPTGSHVVEFLLMAFEEMGVPLALYTDNDVVIKYGLNKKTAELLDKVLENSGGYKLIHHLPGNSRATGKVENSHKRVEQTEKLIGLFLDEGRELTLEQLNDFATQLTLKYNDRKHRSTGQTPNDRWHSQRHVIRRIDAAKLKAVFLADKFDVALLGDLTIKHKGNHYQLPTSSDFPFSDWVESGIKKIKILFADSLEFFTVLGIDGKTDYQIPKVLAQPDVAGEFKQNAESSVERLRKELTSHADELAKQHRERNKSGYSPAPLPYFDTQHESEKILRFPLPVEEVTAEQVIAIAPERAASLDKYCGELMTFWDAVAEYEQHFAAIGECKSFLDTVFADREDEVPQSEIDAALRFYQQPRAALRAV